MAWCCVQTVGVHGVGFPDHLTEFLDKLARRAGARARGAVTLETHSGLDIEDSEQGYVSVFF